MRPFILLLCLICPAASGGVKRRAVGGPFAGTQHILLIVAHPDDETVFAPLLGSSCVDGTATCSFLVMTRGEGGVCGLPGGCAPDLGTIREKEMQAAAALFRAGLRQWGYPDVMENPGSAWAPRNQLLARIREVIDIEQPTIILTFDPAHGTTCHPAHREIAGLVIEAAASQRLYLLETFARFENGRYRFANARPSAAWPIDATTSWSYLIRDVSIHASQFTPDDLEALQAVPADERRVYLATPDVVASEPAVSCP